MPSAGFEPAISGTKRPQTYAWPPGSTVCIYYFACLIRDDTVLCTVMTNLSSFG